MTSAVVAPTEVASEAPVWRSVGGVASGRPAARAAFSTSRAKEDEYRWPPLIAPKLRRRAIRTPFRATYVQHLIAFWCQRDHLFARFGICIRYIGACQSELSTDFSTGEGTVCEGSSPFSGTHRSWCASVVFDQAFEPIDGRRDAVLTRQPVGDLSCGRCQRDSLSQSFGEGCAAQPAKGCGSDPHCV